MISVDLNHRRCPEICKRHPYPQLGGDVLQDFPVLDTDGDFRRC